ncbi:hypothetical protein SAMN05428961_110111 [Paenibacillus sp. OK060]|uniref:hypothetical protein n=1 Tax=Paenibacillus sp. OK060 TaxID=1881034 RepID=UPI000881649F|nr:hypothetical protein [Paenibacillus sp. OK060]SDM16004.1 hypothetical protein SAMN05428961_110111 [Paenibacillus sp. OK060]
MNKKIISSLLTLMMLFSISTSVFAEDLASNTNDPYAPTVTYEQNEALFVPNGIPITVSPSYSSLGVYVGNIGVDALDNVTVSGTVTDYGALAPKSGSVPAVVGKTFVWNVPMTKTTMIYDVKIRVIDGSGTRNLTGNARLEYSEAQLASLNWHAGSFVDRRKSLEYHFNSHKSEVGTTNLYAYLLAAGTTRDDVLANPNDYNETISSGATAAHKYKHKTNGKFIILADSGKGILSFGR